MPPPTAHYVNQSFEFEAPFGRQAEALLQHIESGKEVKDIMEPKWWTGTPPLAVENFVIDCKGAKPVLDDALRQRICDTFDKHGLVLLKNTAMTELDEMRPFLFETVMTQVNVYEGGSNNRPPLDPYFLEVGAPDNAYLHYHHEMVYVGKSTKALGFVCKDALGGMRGATFVSDSVAATQKLLSTPLGQKLKEKGVCYVRVMNDAEAYAGEDSSNVYNHWQMSMRVNTPEEAEAKAKSMGLKVEWGTDSRGKGRCMYTKYYTSAFEFFPPMDKNLLYTSIADHDVWFDTWPGVAALPAKDRPLQMLFGDDTPFSREEVQQMIDLYDEFGMPIEWGVGDVAIVCNYRWAHGRPAFVRQEGESRTLGVVLGEIYPRVGAVEEKW